MRAAIELAGRAAALDEVPVGAVLVRDDRMVGEGFNRTITDRDPTAHAEMQALRRAAAAVDNYRLTGTTLYVTVEPCTMCAGALVHARVERLVFGTPEPKSGAVVSRASVLDNAALNHRVRVTSGVLGAQCAMLMSDFFREKRQ